MTFSQAVATMPEGLRLWVLWLTVAMIVAPLVLLAFRGTRRDGAVILVANVAVAVTMHWLFAAVGFVRLLGLPHVVIWTPLAIHLVVRLRDGVRPRVAQGVMAAFLVTICMSLVFDWIDVLRYAAGDRGALTEATERTLR